MPTVTKRKKVEKEYTYSEYLRKFRPKSTPDDEERDETSDDLTKLALDKIRKGLGSPPHRTTDK